MSMGRYYYTPGRKKIATNSQGKMLLISHLETLKAADLDLQKTIYNEELKKVIDFFDGSEALNKKKECDDNLNKLKPLLDELAKESKVLGDEDFYDFKKTYIEKKNWLSKNDITIIIRRYAKDESKGYKFLEIAKSIATICDEIKKYSNYCKDNYKQVEKILREHEVFDYSEEEDYMHSFINDKNNNFNLEDKRILLVHNGHHAKGKFEGDEYKLRTTHYISKHELTTEEINQVSKKFSKYFINSMCEACSDREEDMVRYVTSSESDAVYYYYNESKFMEKFIKISEHFKIPLEVHKPTAKNKKKVIEVLERFLRKIELIQRASIKRKEKIENVGYVYVLSNEAYPNIYKIGSTYSLPEERAEELTGTGHLTPFKVVAKIKIKSAEYYEKSIHKLLNAYRVKQGREFFELDLNKIKHYLEKISEISNQGEIKVKINTLEKKLND